MSYEPIFIIGCPRTGSKIYLNAISNHPDVNISPELHILNPRWLHPDFVRTVKKKIGSLTTNQSKKKLLQLIKEEQFYGSFWHMDRIDAGSLEAQLPETEWTMNEIFEEVLVQDAENNGAKRLGAKFPVHFSYIEQLYEWFPDCKIIHITRDPRAIYNSELFKYYHQQPNFVRKQALRLTILLYIIFIYKWDFKIHTKFKHRENYMLSRYEDLVLNFDTQMKKLCAHINIDFVPAMKSVPLKGSSFSKNKSGAGIKTDSVKRYMKTLTKSEIKVIESVCRKEMRARNYL